MEAEHEKWLINRLKEGVEVQELFPHMFAKGVAYYDIVVRNKKTGIVIEVKRDHITWSYAETSQMQISKVFQIVRGEKEKIESSNLTNRYLTFVPQGQKFKSEDFNPFLLRGKIFLD